MWWKVAQLYRLGICNCECWAALAYNSPKSEMRTILSRERAEEEPIRTKADKECAVRHRIQLKSPTGPKVQTISSGSVFVVKCPFRQLHNRHAQTHQIINWHERALCIFKKSFPFPLKRIPRSLALHTYFTTHSYSARVRLAQRRDAAFPNLSHEGSVSYDVNKPFSYFKSCSDNHRVPKRNCSIVH